MGLQPSLCTHTAQHSHRLPRPPIWFGMRTAGTGISFWGWQVGGRHDFRGYLEHSWDRAPLNARICCEWMRAPWGCARPCTIVNLSSRGQDSTGLEAQSLCTHFQTLLKVRFLMWMASTCIVNKSNSGTMKTMLVKFSRIGDFKGYKATSSSAFTLKSYWCHILKIFHICPHFSNSTHPASYQTSTISLLDSILYMINREICLKCKFDLINFLLKILRGIIQNLNTT